MGCDIHAHVEVKINGLWRHYSAVNVERNYFLFCLMAGVRKYEDSPTPIDKPRGLPKDIDFITRFDAEEHWGVDGHSHSWLSADEVQQCVEWYEKDRKFKFMHPPLFGYVFGGNFNSIHKYPDDYKHLEGFTDVRLVFWFDN